MNALVGVLDAAFWLTDEEQFETARIVGGLLDWLNVPGRGSAVELPPSVASEVASGQFAVVLNSHRDSGVRRVPRYAHERDVVVSVDAWRYALMNMLTVAYPDLSPTEVVGATKVLDDLLAALGLPERVAHCFPDEVIRAFRELGD